MRPDATIAFAGGVRAVAGERGWAYFDKAQPHRYRYLLGRSLTLHSPARRVCWLMLNPSTATADKDDATIRRCIGYSIAWGFNVLEVVNLFALRSTDPRALASDADPVGPLNDHAIELATARAEIVVAAWGSGQNIPVVHQRARQVCEHLRGRGVVVCCLGVTKHGKWPVHPLRQRADLLPQPWASPRVTRR
jgi:hypothetical protein